MNKLIASTDQFIVFIGFNYPAITLHRISNLPQPIELLPNMGKLGFHYDHSYLTNAAVLH